MSISRQFGGVTLGNVRRSRRVMRLAAGWAREPGASIPRLSQGQGYTSKAAYQLLGHAQTTPDALQAPHRQLVAQYRSLGPTCWRRIRPN